MDDGYIPALYTIFHEFCPCCGTKIVPQNDPLLQFWSCPNKECELFGTTILPEEDIYEETQGGS